jgi:hypothetical protein
VPHAFSGVTWTIAHKVLPIRKCKLKQL